MNDKEIIKATMMEHWRDRWYIQREIRGRHNHAAVESFLMFAIQKARQDERDKLRTENEELKARWEKLADEILLRLPHFAVKVETESDYIKTVEVTAVLQKMRELESGGSITKYSIKGLAPDHPANKDFNDFMHKSGGETNGEVQREKPQKAEGDRKEPYEAQDAEVSEPKPDGKKVKEAGRG